jgi:hypothetical protein
MPRGWALVMRGKAVEGVAQILQGSGVTQLVSDALGLVVHKQNLGN